MRIASPTPGPDPMCSSGETLREAISPSLWVPLLWGYFRSCLQRTLLIFLWEEFYFLCLAFFPQSSWIIQMTLHCKWKIHGCVFCRSRVYSECLVYSCSENGDPVCSFSLANLLSQQQWCTHRLSLFPLSLLSRSGTYTPTTRVPAQQILLSWKLLCAVPQGPWDALQLDLAQPASEEHFHLPDWMGARVLLCID